jgi:hypothetical protein
VIADVDLIILTRHDGPLNHEVESAFSEQRGVRLIVHRVAGAAHASDRSRVDAIARARNEGKLLGNSRWLMFLDDDVVLEPSCIATLVNELDNRPAFAALAADYLGERRFGEFAHHVSMGATLFRREALPQVHFRWTDGECECQCCCDDLRRRHWGIDYCATAFARHLPKAKADHSPNRNECLEENSRITCICVTHSRVPFLRRSVRCFLEQEYHDRELVVIYQSDDDATRQFLEGLSEGSIIPVEVPAVPRLSLGSLRNFGRQAGTGKYIATWDDDDWHSPARLAEQMRAIQETGASACLLARLTLYDSITKRAYVSNTRPWEQSIVAERAILPLHPDLEKSEDTPVVQEVVRQGQYTLLDRPELYVYTRHRRNTCDQWGHFLNVSRPLGMETSSFVSALINSESHGPATLQTRLVSSIRKWEFFSGEAEPRRRQRILE